MIKGRAGLVIPKECVVCEKVFFVKTGPVRQIGNTRVRQRNCKTCSKLCASVRNKDHKKYKALSDKDKSLQTEEKK